jgi:acyl carrier protein
MNKLYPGKELDFGKDDFLIELGFDSLSVIDLQTNIKNDFGVKIPVTEMFERLTISELSKILLTNISSLLENHAPEKSKFYINTECYEEGDI